MEQNIEIYKIIKKDITLDSLKEFDEIILIGSGKGVASVKSINQINHLTLSDDLNKVNLINYRAIKKVNDCSFTFLVMV